MLGMICLSLLNPIYSNAQDINSNIQSLANSYNWQTLFQTTTGQSAVTAHFGAYVFHGVGDTLYIGLANYRPAESGISMVASYNGNSVQSIGVLNEEGVNEIVSTGNSVIIGGADPHDSWLQGNVYTFENNTFTKHRDGNGLTNVIHTWGIDAAADGTLYAAVSSQDGTIPNPCVNGVSCFGEVYKSTTRGQTWTKLATLGEYRVFDIISFGSDLYALYVNDVTGDNYLARSSNGGTVWETIHSTDGLRRTHMTLFNDKLITLGGGPSANKLLTVTTDGTKELVTLPFSVGHAYAGESYFSNYNQFVVASDGYLYTITSDGGVMRSANLTTWDRVFDTSTELVSLGYWPTRNWLIFSSRGASGTISYINLEDNLKTAITGLPANLAVFDASTGLNAASPSSIFSSSQRNIRITTATGTIIAETAVNLLESRNWSGLQGRADTYQGTSVIHGMDVQPGSSNTYTLYVPVPANRSISQVIFCPDASSLQAVTENCPGAIRLINGQSQAVGTETITASYITIAGTQYWKLSGIERTAAGAIDVSPRSLEGLAPQNTKREMPPPQPELLANQGGIIYEDEVSASIEEGTVPYDIQMTVTRQTKAIPKVIAPDAFQLSDMYDVWLTSFFNKARVTSPAKSSILSISYKDLLLSNDGVEFFSDTGIAIAVSYDEGMSWKILPSVVDRTNKTVSTITRIGGTYMLVGQSR